MQTPKSLKEFPQDVQDTVNKILARCAERKARSEQDNNQKGA